MFKQLNGEENMLQTYKKDYKKITMGLLSLMPDLKDIQRLNEELEWYNERDNRKLYLWRSEETDDFIGVIGVEVSEEIVLLRHISINPSFRNEGISFEILDALEALYPREKVVGTLETAGVITKWKKQIGKEQTKEIKDESE